jgi:RNA polymerase sigma-70 factor (ECF subfamily)
MRQAQRGDREAYRALLDDVVPLVHRFLRRRLGEGDAIDDVVQETLVALHRARHTFDPDRPIEPWLFAIARNAAVDHLRRQRLRSSWEVLVATPPEARVDDGRLPRLEALLGRLSPSQRQAFELVQLEGLSVEAAAAHAGVSTTALKVRAHRAYKALKGWLRG